MFVNNSQIYFFLRRGFAEPPEGARGPRVFQAAVRSGEAAQTHTHRGATFRFAGEVNACLEQMHAKRRCYSSCRRAVHRIQMRALIASSAALLSSVTWTGAPTTSWNKVGSTSPEMHHRTVFYAFPHSREKRRTERAVIEKVRKHKQFAGVTVNTTQVLFTIIWWIAKRSTNVALVQTQTYIRGIIREQFCTNCSAKVILNVIKPQSTIRLQSTTRRKMLSLQQ